MPFGFNLLGEEISLIVAIDKTADCTEESLMGFAGLAIWIPFAVYLMVGQFVICEEYFVPVLSNLGDRWQMAEDAQGATLLAVGSSSPELFTAVLGALLYPDDNPGPGTNVGSAVFNMCVIIGLSAIFAPRTAKLAVIPFLRDSIQYMVGLIELYSFYSLISPGLMEWWEATLLVVFWVTYVTSVFRTDLLAVRCCCCIPAEEVDKTLQEIELDPVSEHKKKHGGDVDYVALGGNEDESSFPGSSYKRHKSIVKVDHGKRGVLYDESGHPVADMDQNPDNIRIAPGTIAQEQEDAELQRLLDELNRKQRQNVNKGWVVVVMPQAQAKALQQGGPDHAHAYVRRRTLMETIEHNEAAHEHGDEEHGHGGGILHKMLIPWVKIFHWTLPQPEGEFASKHIYATIFFIIVWLGLLTFFVVDAATKIGGCFNIPANLLGITLLAVGSSLPDCISSVIVARQMKIDAAVANAFGSNIFDANLAVGFSYVLGSITAATAGESTSVELGDKHATQTFSQLIMTAAGYLVLLWIMMWCTIFRLERWIGYVLLVIYVVFIIIFTILFTHDIDAEGEGEGESVLPTIDPTFFPTSMPTPV